MSSLPATLASNAAILSAPLVLAAMGGYLSERGGVMNIALEGKMLAAACVTALLGSRTGNAWVGLAGGIAVAIALSIGLWTVTQVYGIDHVIAGMGINAIAYGATNFLVETSGHGTGLLAQAAPSLPALNVALFGGYVKFDLPMILAFVGPVALSVVAMRTRPGLWLLAVGSDPSKARMMGLRPESVRLVGLVGTGVYCGLAGALIVGATGRFTDNMTAGSGYIALAAVILGGWRPLPAAFAALGFGFLKAVQIQLQGTAIFGSNLPSQVWQALPYVAVVAALATVKGGTRAPAGIGRT